MRDLTALTIAQIRAGLLAKDFSAVEVTKAYLKRMADHRSLNAYITETPESALKMAKDSDERLASGTSRGVLDGVPLGIKDLFCTKGVRTTAGSRMLDTFIPPYESTVTAQLWDSGAVMLGKLNMDEFAMGSSNLTSAYGPVISPWKATNSDKNYVPGGSSGGSAAAVAASLAAGATATDTGGSIRQPASFCGLVGMKPTYGRCSRWGVVGFASSLDQAGPITKTVQDAALMLSVMSGHDAKDATSLPNGAVSHDSAVAGSLKGIRIGIPKEYVVDGLDSRITKMWEQGAEWLKSRGAEIINISLPHTQYALAVYYILAPAEASSNLARYDGVRYGFRAAGETLDEMYINTRSSGFGAEVQRRLLIGTYVLSAGFYDAYFLKAQKIRRLITNDFIEAFKKVDVILTPSTPNAAFAIGEEPKDPVSMYMNDVLTVPANLAGLPALSLPAGFSADGLPLGLHLIGPAMGDETILRVGAALESDANFTATAYNKGIFA